MLVAGERWDAAIQSKLVASQLGIVLVSPAAIVSQYIAVSELPKLLEKPIVPVMLRPIDLDRHDLRGLEHRQIFRYRARAFSELPARRHREAFAAALYAQIEMRLASLTATAPSP